jgi:SHS2 domain-containing protein
MQERYGYFDHEADMGVIGRGETVEAAFEAAAEATFAMMADVAAVRPDVSVHLEFEEADLEFAFVTWLNRLLAEARSEGLIFGRFNLARQGARWAGDAWGERWRNGLDRGVEVKGATLTMLKVNQTGNGWEARCVVDM